jgi:hypothetical protein
MAHPTQILSLDTSLPRRRAALVVIPDDIERLVQRVRAQARLAEAHRGMVNETSCPHGMVVFTCSCHEVPLHLGLTLSDS